MIEAGRVSDLLSAEEIVGLSEPSITSCIYFLVWGLEVVYVGQSTNVYGRIATHRKDKRFDRILILPCPVERLDTVERSYIKALCPKYNWIGVPHGGDNPKEHYRLRSCRKRLFILRRKYHAAVRARRLWIAQEPARRRWAIEDYLEIRKDYFLNRQAWGDMLLGRHVITTKDGANHVITHPWWKGEE